MRRKQLEISDLEHSKEALVRMFGIRGEIFFKLIQCEGKAIWIPKFVNSLFIDYVLRRKR